MNKNNDDLFYNGYYGKESNDEKQQNADSDGFYHGYYESQDFSMPDSRQQQYDALSQMDMMNESITDPVYGDSDRSFVKLLNESTYDRAVRKGAAWERLFPGRDAVSETVSDPVLFKRMYPDARRSTAADSLLRVIFIAAVAIFLIFRLLGDCISDARIAYSSQQWINNAYSVEAEVTSVQKAGSSYRVRYKFTFEEKEYASSDLVSGKYAESNGLYHGDSGSAVTVYFTQKNPKYSELEARGYPAWWRWLLPMIGVIPLCYALKFFSNCKKGKYVTYTTFGRVASRVKRFKKISQFKGADPSVWDNV